MVTYKLCCTLSFMPIKYLLFKPIAKCMSNICTPSKIWSFTILKYDQVLSSNAKLFIKLAQEPHNFIYFLVYNKIICTPSKFEVASKLVPQLATTLLSITIISKYPFHLHLLSSYGYG